MSFLKKLFGAEPEPSRAKSEEEQAPPGIQMETLAQQLAVEPFAKLNYWRLPDREQANKGLSAHGKADRRRSDGCCYRWKRLDDGKLWQGDAHTSKAPN